MQPNDAGPKSFEHKILPVSCCAPKIFAHFPANVMILIDQGGIPLNASQKNKNSTRAQSCTLSAESIFAGRYSQVESILAALTANEQFCSDLPLSTYLCSTTLLSTLLNVSTERHGPIVAPVVRSLPGTIQETLAEAATSGIKAWRELREFGFREYKVWER
jgi:hypothetical protein